MTKQTKISSTIDYSKDGKHFGYLSIPHSTNDSGWGSLQMPIISIRNGKGPLAVFTGGNHGDEYEGPISLMKIARSLDNNNINGQIIIIPALNFPAFMAGDRVSPIDGLNMNRAFPGKRDGSVTSMIADYLTTKIIPLSDVLVDIHSGGKTMMFSPFATYQNVPNIGVNQKAKEAALSFAAPICLEIVELDPDGMLDTAVANMGKVFVGTELGGGGTSTPATISIAETGIKNILAHFNIINEKPKTREEMGFEPIKRMQMPDPKSFVFSEDTGIYEALIDLDTPVKIGDTLGQVHFPEKPEHNPVSYKAQIEGVLIGRVHKGLVFPGDFLALVAEEIK
jgi:N-alpha-acetyl-L-2,4-diaminobutyrate deacetylase